MAANATYTSSANTLSQFWNSINQKWTTTPVNSQLFCFLPFGNFNQAAKFKYNRRNKTLDRLSHVRGSSLLINVE